jgi:hypothetical protein
MRGRSKEGVKYFHTIVLGEKIMYDYLYEKLSEINLKLMSYLY